MILPKAVRVPAWIPQARLWMVVALAATMPISQALSNICYGLAVAAWVLEKLIKRDWRLPRTSLNGVLLAWVVVIVCSMFNSVDIVASVSGLRKLLKYAFLYFVVLETIGSPRTLRWVLAAWVGGLCIAAGDGLWQMAFGRDLLFGRPPDAGLGGVKRLTGTFNHPNDLSIFLTAGIPIAASGAAFFKRKGLRIAAAVVACFLSSAVLLGYSRSGLIAMLASLVFLAVAQRRWQFLAVAGILVAVQFAMISPQVWQWSKDQPSWLHRIVEPERLMYWHAGIGMVRDHPLIGVGANTFIKRYATYQAPEDPYTNRSAPYAHNMYLHLAAELGVIGFGIFLIGLGRIWSMWHAAHLNTHRLRILAVARFGLGAGMTAYLVMGLLESSLFYSRGAMLFWVMAGSIAALGSLGRLASRTSAS